MPCKGWLVGKGSKDSFLTHTRGILDLSLNFQLLNYETINFCCLIFWFILPCFCQLSLAFPVSLIPGIFPWFSASGLPYPLYFSPLSWATLSQQCVKAKESLEKWHSCLSWWLRTACFRLCPTWYVYSMSVALTPGSEGTVHISSRTWASGSQMKTGYAYAEYHLGQKELDSALKTSDLLSAIICGNPCFLSYCYPAKRHTRDHSDWFLS